MLDKIWPAKLYPHKLSHNQTLSARHQLRVADATQNSFICLRELAHNYYLESPLGANSMQRHRRYLLLLAVRRIDWNLLRKCALCVVCSEQTLFKHICLTRSAFGGHIYCHFTGNTNGVGPGVANLVRASNRIASFVNLIH